MRKHWIDNLRWVTVLLVVLYHIFYFYNNKGVFGGIGGFGGTQPQDVVMYILYPWFMPLLFILAGISARYALDTQEPKVWRKSRTRKLLVPSTIGLLVLHWVTGYLNTPAEMVTALANMPYPVKHIIWSVSGIGPLWFIQDLWLFSMILLLIRKIDKQDKVWHSCHNAGIVVALLSGILFWLAQHTMIMEPRELSADGLINLYKPIFYLVTFLMGYYLFSQDKMQESVAKAWQPLMVCAVIAGVVLTATTFGEDNTSPQYLCAPLCSIYGWLMCLAMIGWFKSKFDQTNSFAGYMTRSSFGLYIVHYVIIATVGSFLKLHTQLPIAVIYLLLTIAVFGLTPLIYETLRRIPFVRWTLFGASRMPLH